LDEGDEQQKIGKLFSMTKIGYPGKWRLQQRSFIVRTNYFEDVVACHRGDNCRFQLAKWNKPVDHGEMVHASTVTALQSYYRTKLFSGSHLKRPLTTTQMIR